MFNKNKKGFTTVELVIVIAIIAILASVLVPTFASLIDKANESADIQAVRQMNIALAVESIEKEPASVSEVIKILEEAGYNSTDKLVPVSAKHGFYWCKDANMITLIKDEGDESTELIFPTEETAVNTAFEAAKTNYSTINFGTNKGDPSTDRTFFDLEPAGEAAGLPTGGFGGGNGGSGEGGAVDDEEEEQMTPEQQLLKVLTEGGTFTLAGEMTIDEAVEIAAGKTATINLGGNTLTIDKLSEDSDVISVSGNLIITGEGKIAIDNESHGYAGICVNDGGTLKLENVSIEGHTKYNIQNYGTISLDKTSLTVNFGWGLFNCGDATITNGEFVANGEEVALICNGGNYYTGGTMTITGTKFSEGTGFVSYASDTSSPIYSYSGAVTLSGVEVTTSSNFANISAWTGASITVESGTFNGKFTCVSASYAIKDGTFSGKTFAELYMAEESFVTGTLCNYDGWTVTRADNVITLSR